MTDTKVKLTDEEIAERLRKPSVRRLLRALLREARWAADPRDGAPCGWADAMALIRALDFEARP